MIDIARSENRWLLQLLTVATLTHAVVFAARPMTTYRAMELGASGFEIGLLASSFAVIPLLFAIPIGRGVDGPLAHFYLRLGAVTQALGALALWLSGSLVALAVAGVVLGLGMLATIVAVQGLLARRTPEPDRDRAFGAFTVAVSAGQFIGPLVATYAAEWRPLEGPAAGLLAALLLACVGVLTLFRFSAHADDVVDRRDRSARDGLWAIISRPGMAAAIIASVALLVAVDLLTIFLPFYGEEKGLSASTVGWLLAARALASLVSRLMVARLAAIFGRRRLLLGSMLCSAMALAAMPFAESGLVLMFLMIMVGFVLGLGQPLTMSVVAGLVEAHSRATALGMRISANRLGQVVLPGVAGVVASSAGAGGVFLFLAVTVGVASLSATDRLAASSQ